MKCPSSAEYPRFRPYCCPGRLNRVRYPRRSASAQCLDEPESPRLNCLSQRQAVLALEPLEHRVRIAQLTGDRNRIKDHRHPRRRILQPDDPLSPGVVLDGQELALRYLAVPDGGSHARLVVDLVLIPVDAELTDRKSTR